MIKNAGTKLVLANTTETRLLYFYLRTSEETGENTVEVIEYPIIAWKVELMPKAVTFVEPVICELFPTYAVYCYIWGDSFVAATNFIFPEDRLFRTYLEARDYARELLIQNQRTHRLEKQHED